MAAGIFRPLPPSRIAQIWSLGIPVNNWLCAQVKESAVFVTEDWVFPIHSRQPLGCLDSLLMIVNPLGQKFGSPIEISLIKSRDSSDDGLYRQLDRVTRLRRLGKTGMLALSWIASGLVGALIAWLLSRGVVMHDKGFRKSNGKLVSETARDIGLNSTIEPGSLPFRISGGLHDAVLSQTPFYPGHRGEPG